MDFVILHHHKRSDAVQEVARLERREDAMRTNRLLRQAYIGDSFYLLERTPSKTYSLVNSDLSARSLVRWRREIGENLFGNRVAEAAAVWETSREGGQ